MAVLFKKDDVTVSFHYLLRNIRNGTDSEKAPISNEEFETIYNDLLGLKALDINDEKISSKIRFKQQVKIEHVEKHNTNFISGIYKTAYWGHEFENSDKGTISAASMNLRPFFFLLYLSKSGKVYIASQYLGTYGGFTALKDTILQSFIKKKQISTRCINVSKEYLSKAAPKEVEIQYARKSKNIAGNNLYGSSGALAFKKEFKDDGFEEAVRKDILSIISLSKNDIRKELSAILKEKNLITVDYDEIKGCKVLVQSGPKNRKVLQLLDHREFSTKFHLDVTINDDGHPKYKELLKETIEVLKTEIIPRNEK